MPSQSNWENISKILLVGLALISHPSVRSTAINHTTCNQNGRPNIIFILADDAGWNDFSFHGSPQIPTPNIDALGLSGIVLNNYYGAPLCTPTRGAILTGKYPIHIRLQHYVVMGGSAEGLPLHEKTLPQHLKELGYSTHLVGKWHLGHARRAYLPTNRGFDSHYGYWIGKQDYYSHYSDEAGDWGYDFRNNFSINFNAMGKYDTDLFTNESVRIINDHNPETPLFLMINHIAPHSGNTGNPLQAPMDVLKKLQYITDFERQGFAGMVTKLDESIGAVVEALAKTNLLHNSVIVFASDNGGAPDGFDNNHGSNWPLRGVKNTLWEGGTRLSALIWSPLIKTSRVSYDLMHAVDWLPTLYEAAGCNASKFDNIDGLSMWKTFTDNVESPREVMLYNIDDLYNNSAARFKNWKLIQGLTSPPDLVLGDQNWDGWYGPSGRESKRTVEDLIPKIQTSLAGEYLQRSGFSLGATHLLEMQKAAEIVCDPTLRQRKIECNASQSPCLFNLNDDPCELRNVAATYPNVVTQLLQLIKDFNKTALPPIKRVRHHEANPMYWGNTWTTWLDNLEEGTNLDGWCDMLHVASSASIITNSLHRTMSLLAVLLKLYSMLVVANPDLV